MQYTSLGRSSAQVSRICLGTMNFGPVIPANESLAIMDAAFAAGINFFDTADVYGSGPFGDHYGQSEEILGQWVAAQGPHVREQLVLATKVHGPMGQGPNDKGLSAIHIRHGVEASLRRLRTDYLDLYQMHHIVPEASVEEVFEAFAVLRQQGKVLYFGSSNFPGWRIAQYQEYARQARMFGLVSEQSVYHLAKRAVELEVIPAASHYGLGLLPWSPLGAGLLGGILAKADRTRSVKSLARLSDEDRTKVERYERFAATAGLAPGELALAWLLHRPAVTAPVVGPRTLDHLRGALAALELSLTETQLAELDEIFPGPGPAPESYAW
jgi:aryl-alcohol dehydrogenase-like predicted oxidoreductase